jgi:hypothetical protein
VLLCPDFGRVADDPLKLSPVRHGHGYRNAKYQPGRVPGMPQREGFSGLRATHGQRLGHLITCPLKCRGQFTAPAFKL